MNLTDIMAQMTHQGQAIQQLADVGPEQARWQPAPESWSILEVVCHLYDEEREDFRVRLKHILEQTPGLPPPIDPNGWVTARGYNQRDLPTMLEQLQQERDASLTWLHTLDAPDWQRAVEGPFGRLSAGDMLAAWVAHDLLHLRQLIELRFAYLQQSAAPYRVTYAGEW